MTNDASSVATGPSRSGISPRGLDPTEVATQRAKYGANVLTPPPRDPWWKQFLGKFNDPVIRILMIAAVIAIAAGSINGEYLEGVGIIVAILLATGLAFVNEFKANREFDVLNLVNDDTPIKVIRGGGYTTVPIKEIVVADVVFVEAGEDVPADGDLLEAVGLQVVESALTGEADANSKSVTDASRSTIPGNRLMRGTKVADGHGLFEVTAVGDATDFGKTARSGVEETGEVTPLNAQLERLSKIIGVVGLGVAVATFAALIARGALVGELVLTTQQWTAAAIIAVAAAVAMILIWLPMVFDGLDLVAGWVGREVARPGLLGGDDGPSLMRWLTVVGFGLLVLVVGIGVGSQTGLIPGSSQQWLPAGAVGEFLKYFMIAVTIIVVAVPEGLAMSVTLSLAYSMRKMTAANTLVRKMDACETIGAATVICSDKTGTLTMNEMRVFEARLPAVGDAPFRADGNHPWAVLVAEAVAANTTAHLDRTTPDRPQPLGNPTEGALLLWLHEQGFDYVPLRDGFRVAVQLTFSTERKFMATLGTSPVLGRVVHVKGAPELVLARCRHVQTADGPTPIEGQGEGILALLREFQSRGMRTLGLAYRPVADGDARLTPEAGLGDLTWLGFVAIADPVRPEVPAAIRACHDAGIRVKMVTGDNPDTAAEIARQIGLCEPSGDPAHHVRGPEFERLGDAEADEAADRLTILSRARPMDKVRLVRASRPAARSSPSPATGSTIAGR